MTKAMMMMMLMQTKIAGRTPKVVGPVRHRPPFRTRIGHVPPLVLFLTGKRCGDGFGQAPGWGVVVRQLRGAHHEKNGRRRSGNGNRSGSWGDDKIYMDGRSRRGADGRLSTRRNNSAFPFRGWILSKHQRSRGRGADLRSNQGRPTAATSLESHRTRGDDGRRADGLMLDRDHQASRGWRHG